MKLERPSLSALASLYFRIGNSTFGSGTTTVVLLSREMTERHWLESWQCDSMYTLARVVPGTNVLAFVAASAYAIRGWVGAIVSLLALSIPASCVIVALTLGYERFHSHPLGQPAISTAMAAIVGIIVGAAWLLAWPKFRPGGRVRTVTLVVAALVLSIWLSPLTILGLAAATGYFWRGSE